MFSKSSVTLAWNSPQKGKTVHFPWKLYKTLFSDQAQHVLAKSHSWASKWWKLSHWPQILSKKGKQCAFHEIYTKRSFQVGSSTFWPNRIFERQCFQNGQTGLKSSSTEKQCTFNENCTKRSFQIMIEGQSSENRHTRLKFSLKRENSALFIKIVQNVLFRTCPARFGKIAFVSVKVVKIVTLASILSKKGKQCAFHKNCTKPSFQVMRSTFWPNRILERQSCQNRQTGLKLSSKRKKSALLMRIVENALFRSWAARFDQIAFLSIKVLKIVTLA